MTHNQIEYLKLKESQRANMASESLTQRRDEAAIEARVAELGETKRHNLAVEDQARLDLGIKMYSAKSGRITAEANRTNAAANTRNAATNERNAATNAYNAQINARNAEINAYNAATNRASVGVQAAHYANQDMYNFALLPYQQENIAAQTARYTSQSAVDYANVDKIGYEIQRIASDIELNGWNQKKVEQEVKALKKRYPYIGLQEQAALKESFWRNIERSTKSGQNIVNILRQIGVLPEKKGANYEGLYLPQGLRQLFLPQGLH